MTLQSLRTILVSLGLAGYAAAGPIGTGQASGKAEYSQPPMWGDSLLIQQNHVSFARPIDPERFLIRPGDQVVVTFLKSSLEPISASVNPDGWLIHAGLGAFDLSHATLAQARKLMLEPLSHQYNALEIEISVEGPHLVDVYVSGAVKFPGNYRLHNSERVSDAVEMAGGVTENGSLRRISLTGGPETISADLERARILGDDQADPYLYGGNHIHVSSRSSDLVQVVGEVRSPEVIELLPTDNLELLIALAGGPTAQGDTSGLYVQGQGGAHPDKSDVIKAGMVISVPRRSLTGPPSASIVGQVSKSGRYSVESTTTVAQLIQMAGGLVGDANRDRITIFRVPAADEMEIKPSGRYAILVSGSNQGDIESQLVTDDDSVFVPRRLDYVKVTGSVLRPGLYSYVAGKSAQYYINSAGGYAQGAFDKEVSLYDRVSEITARVSVNSTVADGDEILVLSGVYGQ